MDARAIDYARNLLGPNSDAIEFTRKNIFKFDTHDKFDLVWSAGLFDYIEDDVFIGPGVSFTNDKYPRSKKFPEKFQFTQIGKAVSIGANATILGGIKIGDYAMIGAGAVVTKDVPAYALLYGNPARVIGKVNEKGEIIEKYIGNDGISKY